MHHSPCARRARRALLCNLSAAGVLLTLLAVPGGDVLGGLPLAARPTATRPSRPSPEPWALPFSGDPAAILHAAAAAANRDGESGDADPVVVLLSEYRYTFDAIGRETSVHRLVYLIATSAADESWSTVQESWSPWHQARPEVRARVLSPDGAVHPLDPAVLSESAEAQDEPDMFGDGRVLRGPLPATGPGAVVEQEVTVRDTAPFFDRGTVQAIALASGVRVRRARVVLEAPAATPLRYTTRMLPGAVPREERIGQMRRLTFEVSDLAAADDPEPGLPPDAARYPTLSFSTGSSWGDIARRYSEIVDGALRGSDLSALLRAAKISAAESQLETVNRVLGQLAEIRYTGVELGLGGIVPRTPAETLRRRFGDCKDKSVLLVAALRALDIPAYIALLNAAEDEPDVEESLPGFGAFNHAVVVVPATPPLWIDPTERFARAGELPVEDQGRLALIASPTATGLTRIPESPASENREVFTREFFLADLGDARVVETTESSGDDERRLRAFYAAEEPDSVHDSLNEYVKRVFRAKSLSAVDHSDPLDLSRPFRLRLEVKDSGRGLTTENAAVVAVSTATLLEHLPVEVLPVEGEGRSEHADRPDRPDRDTETRRNDYYFSRPRTLELRYRIVPPAGFVPRQLPGSRVRRLGPATLSEQYGANPSGVVSATLRLVTGNRRISAREFEDLRQELRGLAAEKPTLLKFDQIGEAYLAAGRLREALAEFYREAGASPQKALPRIRIARALLEGGLGEAARQEAARATRLEPDFAPAYRTLGWTLEHDLLGRRFAAGFDRARALAAYRKAKQLDPQDEAVRASLAILLSHGDRGDLYGSGADLPGAVAEYQALRSELKSQAWNQNLLATLIFAGRFEEVKKLAAEVEDSTEHVEALLVALACTDGAQAAVREAERKLGDAKSRGAALAWAAQSLTALRRYPEAATLLVRAAQQSPDAAALLARAEILRKTERRETISFPPDKPASVARQMIWEMTAERPDSARILHLFSQDLRDALGAQQQREELLRSILKVHAHALREIQKDSLAPREALQEVGLAALHQSISGDDQHGWRIELAAGLGEKVQRHTVFVVREKGEYRIAALGSMPSLLGQQALRRLEAQDMDGARRWLDRASEEVPPAYGDTQTPSFAALWARGEQATAEEARCAALSLLAKDLEPAQLRALVACRDGAATEAGRLALNAALGTLYSQLGNFSELLDTAHRIAAARPGSLLAFAFETSALTGLKRWPDLEKAASRRLEQLPDDAPARSVLAERAIQTGDLARAEEILGRLAGEGRASAAMLDELARLGLLRGHADQATIEIAQRAAGLAGFKSYNALHTLAALYADMGRTGEAYAVILQALDAKPEPSPDETTWYVFGRLAEQYGLPELARGLYARVQPANGATQPLSCYHLAQARLAALGALPAARRAVR